MAATKKAKRVVSKKSAKRPKRVTRKTKKLRRKRPSTSTTKSTASSASKFYILVEEEDAHTMQRYYTIEGPMTLTQRKRWQVAADKADKSGRRVYLMFNNFQSTVEATTFAQKNFAIPVPRPAGSIIHP